MYWEKVPERVKMEAVKKVVTAEETPSGANDHGKPRKRKRV